MPAVGSSVREGPQSFSPRFQTTCGGRLFAHMLDRDVINKVAPHLRKHYPSPSRREPHTKPKTKHTSRQVEMCEGSRNAAAIFQHFWWINTAKLHHRQSPVLRFTEPGIIKDVFDGERSRMMVRKWLKWLAEKNYITIERKSGEFLPNRFFDRASYITVNVNAVDAWLESAGYPIAESPSGTVSLRQNDSDKTARRASEKSGQSETARWANISRSTDSE